MIKNLLENGTPFSISISKSDVSHADGPIQIIDDDEGIDKTFEDEDN